MDRIITQVGRDEIGEIIKNGLPNDAELYYFNPATKMGTSGYVRMYPVTATTIFNVMSDDACFIKVVTRETDDDESSFDNMSDDF